MKTPKTTQKVIDEVMKDLVLVIDTRESAPYKFTGENVVFKKLDAGDYSVKGYENEIAIERKTHPDFFGSITHSRERFERELEKLSTYKVKALVIETDFSVLSRGVYVFSKVNPESVIGTIVKIITDYGIPVETVPNRQVGENLTLRILKRAFLRMKGLK